VIGFVAFDLGKVLASPPDLYSAPAEYLGVPAEDYQGLYRIGRADYDGGGSRVEYWGPLLSGLGQEPTAEAITHLANLDAELWIQLRPSAEAMLTTVYSWGLRTALVSNGPLALGRAVRFAEWSALIDRVFISSELRLSKPDPAVFPAVTAQLEVTPDQVAFIDDRPECVQAANDYGWISHLWVSDADSLTWLANVCQQEPVTD
jgi:putative hydrolase of the HAD superfamily